MWSGAPEDPAIGVTGRGEGGMLDDATYVAPSTSTPVIASDDGALESAGGSAAQSADASWKR